MLEIWGLDDDKIVNKYYMPIIKQYGVEYIIHENENADDFSPRFEDSTMFCCGKGYLNLLQDLCVVAKGRTIGSLRNTVRKFKTSNKLIIGYAPSIIHSDYPRKSDLLWDIELACMVVKYGGVPEHKGDYKLVNDFSGSVNLIKRLREASKSPVPVSVDLETDGSNPRIPGKDILSISITVLSGSAEIVYFYNAEELYKDTTLLSQLSYILNNPNISIRGANFKYDIHWLWYKMGLCCTNFKLDTMLVGSLLDENRSNSLNIHAKLFTTMGGYDDSFNAKYDKSKMKEVPVEDIVQYGGGDTDACLRVADYFKKELSRPVNDRLLKFYTRLLHPAARAFELIEQQGVLIDREKYYKLQAGLEYYLDRRSKTIFDIIPSELYRKPTKKGDPLNPVNPSMLKEYLFTKKGANLTPKLLVDKVYKDISDKELWGAKGLSVKNFMDTYHSDMKDEDRKEYIYKNAKTSMKHFNMFSTMKKAKHLIKNVQEYTLAKKTLSTYVNGFLEYLDPQTDRFYRTYMLFRGLYEDDNDSTGTKTGRTSCFEPALQQLPKHTKWTKALRRCYIAPKGYMILNVDFSEGELRLIADRSGDIEMIKAYKQGISLHAITAAELMETSLKEYMKLQDTNKALYEDIRRNAKVVNFGLPYGMSAFGLRVYAEDGFGLKLTKPQSEKYVDDYFGTFKGIKPWHKVEITHARNKGWVESSLGRIRHTPLIMSQDRKTRRKAERQAINSVIQSCLSDMLLLSTAELDRMYRGQIFPFLMIHDNLCIYVPEDDVEIWAKRVTDVMENLPLEQKFGWRPKIPIVADAEIGYNLANLKKVGK
jgi:DNA polymerase I-like protein with 3'-5' exonuclease and polymerase domains